ncbi:hypothetical protein [Terrisporobacter hibernicus]|uniref:YD repeat-containing protein n=1 Tax=Terrisporobacter hibernicus TaxID=2813371 RepID=A0AAX2ZL21_9FIRM|nr:hypothetical protein [Terrisporobacter hibernicus]UEL49250.1 hypothetical protein JW646_07350 [Terrisporobacter hibernicus]
MSEYLYNNYTSTTQRDEDSPSTIVDELRECEYDKLGRLTETNISDNVSNSISNTVYTYDKVGNRVKEVKDGKTTFYYIILDGKRYLNVNIEKFLSDLEDEMNNY